MSRNTRMSHGLLAALLLALAAPAGAAATAPLGPGDAAPTLALPGAEDAPIDLAAFRGEVVLLNFWASWCAPCLEEMPLLQDLHARKSGEGLSVLAVNLDRKRRPAQGVIDHLGLTLPMAFDAEGAFVSLYAPAALPASFLVGPDGAIRAVYEGALDAEQVAAIEETARALLQGEAP